ncbi:hypothetical protein GCM10027517_19490 [Phycicoccus ginsengisoli]
MSIETQLREALAARAEELSPSPGDAYGRVSGAIRTSQRRRRTAYAGVAAVVLALAVVVPGLAGGDHHTTTPATRTHTLPLPSPDDPRWSSVSTWPVRGPLADDKAFIDSVGQQFADAHVVYAGDLPTSRVVVSYNPSTDGAEKLTMYSGPRGAAAADMAEVSSASGGLSDVVSIREHADNDSTLVVLASPATRQASISPSVHIGLDGTVTRDAFRSVPLSDGMYTELLENSPPMLTRVSVGADGRAAAATAQRVTLTGRPTEDVSGKGSICLSCTGEDFRVRAEQAIGEGDAYRLGLDPQSVHATTRFFGSADPRVVERADFGTKSPVQNHVIVVDTKLPAGQVLRSALVVVSAKDGSQSMTVESASGVPIDASTAADRPFVLKRGLDEHRVLNEVFAPTAAKAQLVSSASLAYPSSAVVPVRKGTALVVTSPTDPAIATYDVVTFDSSGRQIGRWPVDLPSEESWTAGTTP